MMVRLVLLLVALVLAGVLASGLARSADAPPRDCSLPFALAAGSVEPCLNHDSLPAAYYAELLRDQHDLGDARALVALLEAQKQALEATLANERESAAATLRVCETGRAGCEASRAPPACPRVPLLANPGFCYPVASLIGFGLGVFVDHQFGK